MRYRVSKKESWNGGKWLNPLNRDDSTWKKRVSLFTSQSHTCEMIHVLLEMDRILRPQGYALIRESSYFVDAVATISKGLRWDCHVEAAEDGTDKEKILICKKKL
ncbi:probable methyltransferase PMT21 [Tanacetum coccineum]